MKKSKPLLRTTGRVCLKKTSEKGGKGGPGEKGRAPSNEPMNELG